jgi:hypothetical protein
MSSRANYIIRSSLATLLVVSALLSTISIAKEVDLKWKSIEDAKKYNLEVSKDPEFKKTVLEKTIKINNLKYELDSGIYYLRVQGVNELGKPGVWSKPFKLVVTAPIKPSDSSDIENPKSISFSRKAPDVETTWNSGEGATGFHVVVKKDGEEVFSEDTKKAKTSFRPTEAGEYTVSVSSQYGKYRGPPVVVNTLSVEKTKPAPLVPPVVEEKTHKRWTNKKPVDLAWHPVPGADNYNLKIYQILPPSANGGRAPASTGSLKKLVATYPSIKDGHFKIPPLPPGRYVANIEAAIDSESEKSTSEYKFEVKRAKPIEFEKFDLAFHFKFTQIKYMSNLAENANASSSTNSTGGAGEIKSSMYFPDSNIGVRLDAAWGGFLINNINITYNDFSLAATYLLLKPDGALKIDVRPYLGARAITAPIIINTNDGSNSTTITQIFTPTLFGPMAGFDIYKSITERISLLSNIQITAPIAVSSIGQVSTPLDTSVINPKIELGAGYQVSENYKVVALVGFQDDKLRWTSQTSQTSQSPSGGGPNSSTVSGSSQASTSATSFIIGVETSEDLASKTTDRFSDLDLSARYIYKAFNYSAIVQENKTSQSAGKYDTAMKGAFSGEVETEVLGWLNHSNHGTRIVAAWGGVAVNGTTVSYPEFYGQWAYRFKNQRRRTDWQFNNYLGVRSWVVPDLVLQQNNRSGDTGQPTRMPQLVGAAETVQVVKHFGSKWAAQGGFEISAPALTANKDANISKIFYTATSAKAELGGTRSFSEDLNVNLGIGYRYDQLKYVAPNYSDSEASTLQNWSPTVSLGATYSF